MKLNRKCHKCKSDKITCIPSTNTSSGCQINKYNESDDYLLLQCHKCNNSWKIFLCPKCGSEDVDEKEAITLSHNSCERHEQASKDELVPHFKCNSCSNKWTRRK